MSSEPETFYILIATRECDDPYYAPYHDVIQYYKSKEQAIESARNARKRTKKYSSPKDCYYVQKCTFNDTDVNANSNDNKECEDEEESEEEMKKYYYYGEDEEIFFDDDKRQDQMVYLIGRKRTETNKANGSDDKDKKD
jgi:hypothetical protein